MHLVAADVITPTESVLQALQTPAGAGIAVLVGLVLVGAGVAIARSRRPALSDESDATEQLEDSSALVSAPPVSTGPSVVERFRKGFSRTSEALGFARVFGGTAVDEPLFEELEEALIRADVGVRTATTLLDELKSRAKAQGIQEPAALREALRALLTERLGRFSPALLPPPASGPHVILVVGVNGSGKTTTIGKLAHIFKQDGRKVLMGAGDTFRAGAIQQLRVWSERADVDIVAHQEGADAAAVLYDALEAAKARGHDVVLCDTAGRLQAKRTLMDELGKVTRVLGKAVDDAPHEVLLVLDGTMGQNAISQARTFGEVTGVTGVVLTKLDGTAKGGVVIAIMEELGLPVKFVGIGEGIEDLRPFDPAAFVDALT